MFQKPWNYRKALRDNGNSSGAYLTLPSATLNSSSLAS